MRVTVRYFAQLREACGLAVETCVLPPDISTIASLRQWLADVHGRGPLLTTAHCRQALNQKMAADQAKLTDGDEIAFFPPVTGG